MKITKFKFRISDKNLSLLLLLILIGTLLRLYNLNWGAPFYFHPDERNIASGISQLRFPDQLNPHFFAYGSLPLYSAFSLGLVKDSLTACHKTAHCMVSFESAILSLRIISSLLSVLLIPLTYLVAEKLKKGMGLTAAALSTASTGYIQFAHFGTVEMWLTFFTLLLFYLLLFVEERKQLLLSIGIGCVLGVLISAKITSLAALILPPFAYALYLGRPTLKKVGVAGLQLLLIFLTAGVIFLLTNPFVYLDFPAFQSSMRYESEVAFGTLPVFYTGEFINSVPVLFQLTAIYPFLINPLLTVVLLVALILGIKTAGKDKNSMLLFAFFLVLFSTQAFLYVKWTRYMVPTLPFIYLIISLWISNVKRLRVPVLTTVITVSSVFAFSYFITAFVETDTRIDAAHFAAGTIPKEAKVLSEVYDLGITPFNQYLSNITLFNTYDLDNHSPDYTPQALNEQLAENSYVILPSQRVLKTRLLDEMHFPIGNSFYAQLYSEKGEYKKVYESPCSLFCQITYLGDPLFRFEQTASVFDRPVVLFYRKQ